MRMDRALQELVITGIKTTVPFHRWLVNNKRFIEGDFDTTFLDQEYFQKKKEHDESFQELACIAAAIRAFQGEQKETKHEL